MIRGLLQNLGTIHISLLFLFLLIATHFGKKQGDFGVLTSCALKDGRLRIDCWYPPCNDETPFQCEFTNSKGELLGSSTKSVFRNDSVFSRSGSVCHLYLNNHRNTDKAVNFTCRLTRRKRLEKKNLTVEYDKGKGLPKACPSDAVPLREESGFPWSMALLTMLTILL